jgi:wyosine [tRNA(Phe)-imidazoG37] synthetase (radical SAM superfamily)
MLLSLQKSIVYGPVASRRLGHSLGINLLPATEKVCTFNCVYCQYGWSDFGALGRVAVPPLPSRERVRVALEESLRGAGSRAAFLTFSGNGEPTLHPEFPAIVGDLVGLRDRLAPGALTAILSNSTTVTDKAVRDALALLDVRIMKLDAGKPDTVLRYNQPAPGTDFEAMVEGLGRLKDVTIQALFSTGPAGNFSKPDVEAWVSRVKALAPRSVQIYTLARGYPSAGIGPLTREELAGIGGKLVEAGVHAEVF